MSPPVLEQWTIYKYPADAPGKYVVRRWEIGDGVLTPREAYVGPTLEAVRMLVPHGRYPIRREPGDDPCIVETWT